MVEATTIIDDRVGTLCGLEGALAMALANRKIEVLLQIGRIANAPLNKIAKLEGMLQ